MSQAKTPAVPPVPPVPPVATQASLSTQQASMLRLRISDMMTQFNTVMKTMTDENAALEKENADLKAKQQTSKP